MSDQQVEAHLRAARASDEGAEWLRAAQALARAGRHCEAARAARHARSHGQPTGPVFDALTPDLEEFRLQVTIPFERTGLLQPRVMAFDASGRTLFAARDREIVAWDVASATSRCVAVLPGQIHTLAAHATGERLAAAWTIRHPLSHLATVDPATGTLGPHVGSGHVRIVECALARGRGGDLLVAVEQRRLRAYLLDPEGAPLAARPAIAIRRVPSVDATGSFAIHDVSSSVSAAPDVDLHDPAHKRPRETLAVETEDPLRSVRVCGERVLIARETSLTLHAPPEVFKVEGFKPRSFVSSERGHLSVSPSGRLTAVRPWNGPELVDLRTGQRRPLAVEGAVACFAWSPSGRMLAVWTHAGRITLFAA